MFFADNTTTTDGSRWPFIASVVALLTVNAWAAPNAAELENPPLLIGFSQSVPAVGDRVEVRLYLDEPGGRDVEVTFPDGTSAVRTTNPDGCFTWFPRKYGKYTFRVDDALEPIWVTAQRMYFFVWDATVPRRYVTHVLKPKDADLATRWRRRGVRLVNWAGGEYLSRESQFGDKAFKTSKDWLDNWSKDNLEKDCDGITIDEIYVSDRPLMAQLCRAVVDFRQTAGRGFDILPFFSGIEWDAVGPMWDLRDANVPCMEENYWGGEEVYTKRWADVRLFRLERSGAVLSQAPGFFLDESRRGPRTIDEFRADIALCRRIAPEMRGISLFNAYDFREADRMADEVIEHYFFMPVIHLHPRNGQLIVQNIGNENTLEGAALQFLADDEMVLRESDIPILAPNEEAAVAVPPDAKRIRLRLPEGMNHVYENGVSDVPKNLHPLQVASCSLEQDGTLRVDEGEPLIVEISFNKPIVPVKTTSIWLKGANGGVRPVEAAQLTADRKSLAVEPGDLPEDRYSLRLLSGSEHFRDESGNPLDGSGNGFCENAPGLFKDADHFAVDFKVQMASP